MSLKHFHILFVTVSTLLLLSLAWAAWSTFRAQNEALWLVLALTASVSTVALIVYGVWFWKKMKNLIL